MDKILAEDLLMIAEREIPLKDRRPVLEVSPISSNLAYRCEHGDYLRGKIVNICKSHPQYENITTDEAVWVAWKLGLIIPNTMWDLGKIYGESK